MKDYLKNWISSCVNLKKVFKETQPPKRVYSQWIVDIRSDHGIKLFNSARMSLSQEDKEPNEREHKQEETAHFIVLLQFNY